MLKLNQMVERCLRDYPETRNSDIALTIQIWEVYYPQRIKTGKTGERGIWLRDLYDLPREDNVKRHRALIQNGRIKKGQRIEGKYLPTSWEVAKQRNINRERWQEYCSNYPDQYGS